MNGRAAQEVFYELDGLGDRCGRIEDRLSNDANEPPGGDYWQAPRNSTLRELSEPNASDRAQR